MFKYFFLLFIVIVSASCSPKDINENSLATDSIARILTQKTDSNSIMKKYLLRDSTVITEFTYPKSIINKSINGIFNIKYKVDSNNNWTYEASSNDSVFYKAEIQRENDNRNFIREGNDLIFLEQYVKDSASYHKLYVVNPSFLDSVTISTYRYINDSLVYIIKNHPLKGYGFIIKNQFNSDINLVVNQYPKCCDIFFTDTVALKNQRLLTPN